MMAPSCVLLLLCAVCACVHLGPSYFDCRINCSETLKQIILILISIVNVIGKVPNDMPASSLTKKHIVHWSLGLK